MGNITKTLTTAEDLWRMLPDGARHELVAGELTTMAPIGSEHAEATLWIGRILGTYILEHRLGRSLGAEGGFLVARNPDTVLAPDFAFISKARVPAGGMPKAYFAGAPDLAIEVLSPGDRVMEVDEKTQRWLSYGAQQVWIVNSIRRTITIHLRDGQAQILRPTDTLDGGTLLPGFRIKVADLFPPRDE